MNKPYIITCISHNRHENVKEIFEKFGTEDVVFFVKDATDALNYQKNGAKDIIISGSLMDSRNKSLDHCFSKGKICVQLSDDLEKTAINDFTGKRTKKFVTAIEVIEGIMPDFIGRGEKFAGFPPTDNPFYSTKEFEFNKFIVGDFIFIKPTKLRFDDNLRLKEDYDYCLQHMKEGTGCIRYGKYLNSFKHYSNKGGAVSYRNNEVEQNTIEYLMDKWGDCIKLNTKRENEILLHRNSYEILNTTQTSLF